MSSDEDDEDDDDDNDKRGRFVQEASGDNDEAEVKTRLPSTFGSRPRPGTGTRLLGARSIKEVTVVGAAA